QVANLSTSQRFKSFCYDDDDYEESTIPLNEIISQLPQSIAITPVLPNLEPEDSLIMGNEELSTIPKKESDEFIKSSVAGTCSIPKWHRGYIDVIVIYLVLIISSTLTYKGLKTKQKRSDGLESSLEFPLERYEVQTAARGDDWHTRYEVGSTRFLEGHMACSHWWIQLSKAGVRGSFFQNQALTSGTLPSNTILNPKGEMKAITTHSVFALEGPSILLLLLQKSTAHIQPPVIPIPIPEPDVPKTLPKPNIPYPSRLNDQKLREKATNQMEKFFQIFQDLHFDISFADALLLMPKFASTIKSLLTNKDKLFELAKIPLNENCSAMLLKKLPEKLGDPGKFLIPCDFPGMDVCHALADLGASINLMPLSIWKKLSLPKLTPTWMTLELANRSITRPKGFAEDVFVKVGKFHFHTDFVVVDFDVDPRVPLILGRSFLRTGRALIDVYREEITLWVNDEAVTFNINQTTRYSSTYDDMSVNQIDVIDVACEEYAQEVLGFSNNSTGGNPTLTSEPIISNSSLSQKELYCIHNNVDDLFESDLNSKLLSINLNSQHLDKEKQEVKNIAEPTAKHQTRISPCLKNFKVIHKESIISLNNTPQISPVNAITHDLPTKEPEDSLIMGNEELSTIPEKESDEFIKSSVEDLIPIPRESEDSSGSDSESVLPSSDDFSPIFEEKSVTFSNPLFDSNDFTSSDNELLSDEDVPEDVKIYSNPLFEFDDEYISNDVNPLFDEVLENIESKDSYVSNLDEPALLVTPLSDANEDECFDPGGVIDEIDAFLDMDISTDIENGYHDSEGDIIYLESLLIDDTSPNLPPDVFLDHDPRSLKDEPDNDDLMTEDKVFDPGIHEKSFSPTFVFNLLRIVIIFQFTIVRSRIFHPYLTLFMGFSFSSLLREEAYIFDPGNLHSIYFSSLNRGI
ncbi:reverse transcriptase domain-containing protein, partial [Tanacetum coccineum]